MVTPRAGRGGGRGPEPLPLAIRAAKHMAWHLSQPQTLHPSNWDTHLSHQVMTMTNCESPSGFKT